MEVKKVDEGMKPFHALKRIVNSIIPKIDGPFAAVSTKVTGPTMGLNDDVVKVVVDFFLAKFNIKVKISVDHNLGIISVYARRDPVMPLRMSTADRFYYEIVECMDAKIKDIDQTAGDLSNIQAAFDMNFFNVDYLNVNYLPDCPVMDKIKEKLVRKYINDGWKDASVKFDMPVRCDNINSFTIMQVTLNLKHAITEEIKESFNIDTELAKVEILKEQLKNTKSREIIRSINIKITFVAAGIMTHIDINNLNEYSITDINELINKLNWLANSSEDYSLIINASIDELIMLLISKIH